MAPDTTRNKISCKDCSRTLATTSSSGDLVPVNTLQTAACATCEPFETLHTALTSRDSAFAALAGRRPEHGGRVQALEAARAARKDLHNFLLDVEAPIAPKPGHHPQQQVETPSFPQSALSDKALESHPTGDGTTPHPGPAKRARTPSSTTPPLSKRPRLSSSTRSVTFDPSIIFHDETSARPYLVFNRESDVYVPGRNAPKEKEVWLNTSGHGVAPSKFFGVRRAGKGWAVTKEGKDMDEWWWGRDAEEDDGGDAGVTEGAEKAAGGQAAVEEFAVEEVKVEDASEKAEEVGTEGEIAGPPENENRPAIADIGKETLHEHIDMAAELYIEDPAPPTNNEHCHSADGEHRPSSVEKQTTLALHPQRSLSGEHDSAQQCPKPSPSIPSPIPRDSRGLSSAGGSLECGEPVSSMGGYSLPAFPF
jgi:hypothetical protein